jgi:hypothetical protein
VANSHDLGVNIWLNMHRWMDGWMIGNKILGGKLELEHNT